MDRIDIINSIVGGSPNKMREKYFQKYHKETYDNIKKFTSELDVSFKFKVWHWVNNQPSYILCGCGNKVSPHIAWKDGYRKFCSTKCSANDPKKKDDLKKTLLKKYGVDHYSKTDEYNKKVRKTSLDKYGVDNYSKTDEYIRKSKQTCLKRYGVDSYTKTDEYRLKSKQTCLEKYGVESYTKTDDCKRSIKKSLSKRIGCDMIFKSDEYRKNNFKISNDEFHLRYLNNSESEFDCDNGLPHTFIISTDNYYGRKSSNNKLCTVCNPISSSSSLKEESLYEFIFNIYKGNIIRNYKDQFEIDIYLPEINIGIEFNGIYFHSDKFRDRNYHVDKTNFFKERNIHIIHIWEDDWTHRVDIVKSQILNLLKLNRKIYARNCTVKEVSTIDAKAFLENNHIQGFVKSPFKIGLYYNEELISYMSFDTFEGRKKMTDGYNLNRFCSLLNTSVVGGASKLLKYFINKNNPSRIISYADKDWSRGELYYKIGFKLISDNRPDYKYIVGNKRIHKSRYRNKRTKTNMTESEFMSSININKIYDCGKLKFELLR